MGGWGEEGEGDISMNSTVLKKKRFILIFQNWQIETHDRFLWEGGGRRGRGTYQ